VGARELADGDAVLVDAGAEAPAPAPPAGAERADEPQAGDAAAAGADGADTGGGTDGDAEPR
jgi:hypothetical protein